MIKYARNIIGQYSIVHFFIYLRIFASLSIIHFTARKTTIPYTSLMSSRFQEFCRALHFFKMNQLLFLSILKTIDQESQERLKATGVNRICPF